MAAFDAVIEIVIQHEGGLVNNPKDKGGLTKYGISQKSYPNIDIASLTVDDAKTIYKRDFWPVIDGDNLPPATALSLMDFAVNSNPQRAIRHFQRALETPVTSKMDALTKTALKERVAEVSDLEVARALNRQRARMFEGIITNDPSQGVFRAGWMNRLASIEHEISKGAQP